MNGRCGRGEPLNDIGTVLSGTAVYALQNLRFSFFQMFLGVLCLSIFGENKNFMFLHYRVGFKQCDEGFFVCILVGG